MNRPVVILFARLPRLGIGKRRLARTVGDRAAWRISRFLLDRTERMLRPMRGIERVLAATPDHHTRHAAQGFARIGQKRGDLGTRMEGILRRFPHRPAIIVGGDIPGMSRADIRAALKALRGHDAVFGPAMDGGYWLVGLAGRRPSRPFADVRWSSSHALADTLHNFTGRRVALLRPLADLDEAESLAELSRARSRVQ